MVTSGRHGSRSKELSAHSPAASMTHGVDWKQGEALSSRSLNDSDSLLPAKPQLPNLRKQHRQLGTKYLNTRAYGRHFALKGPHTATGKEIKPLPHEDFN